MNKTMIVLTLLLSFTVRAENIDQKLESYIKLFKLKALRNPGKKNPALFELGKELFAEKQISGNNNISCADCHHPDSFTGDSLPLGLGEGADGIGVLRTQKKGHMLARNTPALFNLGYEDINSMFWDGRIQYNPATKVFYTPDNGLNGMNPRLGNIARVMTSSLAAQAIFPMANDNEMRGQPGTNEIADAKTNEEAWLKITRKILALDKYKKLISLAFPGETSFNIGHFGQAIAEFERFEFVANNTPYDQYLRGDKKALTYAQKFGMQVFFDKGKCGNCHTGEHLSNFEFKNVGVPQIGPGQEHGNDFGRYQIVQDRNTKYAFKVPSLRNVALTAPYFHNGAFQNLAQVVEHYDDVAVSLDSYNWVAILSNYTAAISGHDHADDQDRLDHLAPNLMSKLFFEEFEEHALVEFMTNALTDPKHVQKDDQKRFTTEFRLQFNKDGFTKIKRAFADITPRKKTYYYFDTYKNKSYQLRKLARPIKVVVIKDQQADDSVLNYREVRRKLFAAAETSTGNYYISAELVDERDTVIEEQNTADIAASFNNFFTILYTFNNPEIQSPIPASSLMLMKQSWKSMDANLHQVDFKGKDVILDRLDFAEENLTYAPTSVNVKEVYKKHIWLNNRLFIAELLKSNLRDEKGGYYETYALEIQSSKLPESHLQKATDDVISFIQKHDITMEDFDDYNPSPSNLTLKALNQVMVK